MRIMGLDFGTKRIGVAVSDGLMITAQGQDSIYSDGFEKDLAAINKVIAEYGVSEVVVGLPINMDGTHSQKTKETLEFVDKLAKALTIPVKTWDERLTSLMAERAMLEADMSRQKRRKLSDKIAAQLILQSYMDSIKKGSL